MLNLLLCNYVAYDICSRTKKEHFHLQDFRRKQSTWELIIGWKIKNTLKT